MSIADNIAGINCKLRESVCGIINIFICGSSAGERDEIPFVIICNRFQKDIPTGTCGKTIGGEKVIK